MNDVCEAESQGDGAAQTTAPLSFAGPVRLIPGENATGYDELLARVGAVLKPADIIEQLDLLRPIYSKTTNYGHFGKIGDPDITWEQTDKADILRREAGL